MASNWQRLHLENFGSPSNLSYILSTPRFRASSHIIFFILESRRLSPVLVAKLPRLSGDNARLDREFANLSTVHSFRDGGFNSVPRVIAYDFLGSSRIMIETALRGRAMSSAFVRRQGKICVEKVVDWLIELHLGTTTDNRSSISWFERSVEQPIEQISNTIHFRDEEYIIEKTLELTSPLRQQDIPLVFEHRDLGPPNILLSEEGEIGVVDWELAEPTGLPAVDLFFFLTLVAFAQKGAKRNSEYISAFHETFFCQKSWAKPYINRYARKLELSPKLLVSLFISCWSRYVKDIILRLDMINDSNHDTLIWLRSNRYYALWRHAIKHVEEINLL